MAPQTKRVDLGDGDWIEVTENPEHDRVNRVYKAWQTNSQDPGAYLDVMADVILALGVEWVVKGTDGHELPLTVEGIAAAPFKKTYAAFLAAKDISTGIFQAINPKTSTPPSP